MEDSNSEDLEMECEEISTPEVCKTSTSISDNCEDRPVTPPNNVSTVSSSFFLSPANILDNGSETSFIKRCSIERSLLSKHRPRLTSTPLHKHRMWHSKTLPGTSFPDYSSLKSFYRQCRSSDGHRQTSKPAQITVGPEEIPYEYVNPFTPDGKVVTDKENAAKMKRLSTVSLVPRKINLNESTDNTNSDGQTSMDSNGQDSPVDLPRRPRLCELNVSRFNEEFLQLKEIGKGVHGCVYKCLNRMNGCLYAIKRTIKPIKSSIQERIIRNEIYAHGVLDHPNIVRNYSCWTEDGFVFIQNEYCNGGSLENYIQTNTLSETLLCNLLAQMASALRYIHKKGLAHMDVKPGNIFLCIDTNKENSIDSDGGFSDEEKTDDIVFKLGDLGHITKLDEKHDVEEGDCRYLSREILEEKYKLLDKGDIFALGLTVFEAADGGPLPKNGEEWHDIRNGNLRFLDMYSKEFNNILKTMTQPDAEKRPNASELIRMVKPNPSSPLLDDVSGYIEQYRRTNTRLEHTALAKEQYLKLLYKSHKQLQEQLQTGKEKTGTKDKLLSLGKKKGSVTKARVVGRKTKRSSSTTTF